MPDPRPRGQRADDAIAGMFRQHGNDMDSYALGLVAVANAILATTETPPPAVRIGHFVPIDAWQEIVIRRNFVAGTTPERWEVRSTTIDKTIEAFAEVGDAIEYRDHLIQNYDRQGA